MGQPSDRASISEKYEAYGAMLYRLCYLLLCSKTDAEDAVQDTFIRFLQKQPGFTNDEHEKAWLIRVAKNICYDKQRFRFRRKAVALSEAETISFAPEDSEVLRELMCLPEKCKTPLYLHYYEGYSVQEIAEMLRSTESAVKTWLFRGRQKLKLML